MIYIKFTTNILTI